MVCVRGSLRHSSAACRGTRSCKMGKKQRHPLLAKVAKLYYRIS